MKLLYTVDENIKCCSHYGKQYSGSSKNETQNYHMIQQFHFWVYTQKNLRAETPTDISTPVFTAALVTTAKRWKQPKCPLTEEWLSSKRTQITCWQGCGEKGTLLRCWWKCKLVQPIRKTVWRFLKKLKIELPYDPAIPLLGIYLEKTKALIRKETCTPMFTAALFIIAKTMEAT